MLLMVTGGLPISLEETNAAKLEEEPVPAIAQAVAPDLVIAQVVAPERAIARVVALERAIAQAAGPVLATAPVVAPELVIAQAEVVEQEIVQAAGPAIVPAVAELALVQVVVVPRTKSVTAAHHRGRAHLAAEDLAAVVETTREPA